MARGTESKNIITAKLLETFAGSFIYDKNIIIPMVENGENLQIKIALTCIKTNVSAEDSTPAEFKTTSAEFKTTSAANASNELNFEDTPAPSSAEINATPEERANIARLVEKFNIR